MRRFAFSQIEILTAILILAIMAGFFTISPHIGKITAKSEAEKIIAKIDSVIHKANHRHLNFKITFHHEQIIFTWFNGDTEPAFNIDKDFSLRDLDKMPELEYSWMNNNFSYQAGHLKVERSDGEGYYIILNPAGRLRASQKKQ